MQAVDVLRDNRRQLAHLFELCKCKMSRVWFCLGVDHLIEIILEKLLGMLFKEGVTEHRFGRIRVLLCLFVTVESLIAAKIGNLAFGRDTGAAKKDDAAAGLDQVR